MADVLEHHREAIRARGHKVNPYRMGREMGREWHRQFWRWSEAARQSRDFSGRPEQPQCPYDNAHSQRNWLDGFRLETKAPRPKQ